MNDVKTFRILGTFSKGVPGSVSVNFGRSAGRNCARKCRHHPRSTARKELRTGACYAVVIESRPDRQPLADKLERHEQTNPTTLINRALWEIQALDYVPAWVRISTNGSVPNNPSRGFIRALRVFLTYCRQEGIDVHFPVETAQKAKIYRELVGDLVIVRESIQDAGDMSQPGQVSMVAGDDVTTGRNIRARRIQAAKDMANERRALTGRKVVVCPAITAGWSLKSTQAKLTGARRRQDKDDIARLTLELERRQEAVSKSKCGSCKACALDCDVVYPLH